MIADPLVGCRQKLARSQAHFDELSDEVIAFIERQPFRPVGEFDGESSCYVFRLEATEEPPFDHWATIIGDWAHNLRSALDYLVWQLLILNGVRGSTRTQFPIFVDRSAFERHGRRMLHGLRRADAVAIELLQPYRSNDPESDPLVVLNRLSNFDKHRRLHPVVASTEGLVLQIEAVQDVRALGATVASFGPFVPGDEIVRAFVERTGPAPEMRLLGRLEVDIVFDDDGRLVGDTMLEIGRHTVAIVESFEPVFRGAAA